MEECWAGRPEDRPTFSGVRTSVERILESKAGYIDLNMNSTLEAGLQSSDSTHQYQGLVATFQSLQHSHTDITHEDPSTEDLTESGYMNV